MAAKKPRQKEKIHSHTEHGKLGNPDPVQTKEFKSKQFKASAPTMGVLAKTGITVKLPVDVDEYLRSLPAEERIALMRETLVIKVRELIEEQNESQ